MFDPTFHISPDLLSTLTAAERSYQILKTAAVPTDFAAHLHKRCLVALTHFSTQIEGNALTLQQVAALVAQKAGESKTRDEREVQNYFTLLTQLPTFNLKHKGRMTASLICQCHRVIQTKIVKGTLLGQLRTVQNAVYNASGGLAYLPPTPTDVPRLITDLCQWINRTTLHPVLVAGILHNHLVTIHPFIDGNGRTARAISLYWLLGHGWDLRQWVPIDRFYAEDRPRYYAMLQQSYSHNYYEGRHATDFTPWLEYYAEGLRITLEETCEEIRRFQERGVFLNARQQKIIRDPQGHTITPRAYAIQFGISTRMATRDLRQLTAWGFLRQVGKGRSTQYAPI